MPSYERDTAIRGFSAAPTTLALPPKPATAAEQEPSTSTAAVKLDDELMFPPVHTPSHVATADADADATTAAVDATPLDADQPVTNGTVHQLSALHSDDISIDIDNETDTAPTLAERNPSSTAAVTLPELQQLTPTVQYYPTKTGHNDPHPESTTFTPIVQKPPSWNFVGTLLLILLSPLILLAAVASVFLSRMIVTDDFGAQPNSAHDKPPTSTLPTGGKFIQSVHQYWLYRQIHQQGIDTSPRAYVLLTHGLGEYSERPGYMKLIRELNKQGIIVVSWHQQGHGRSTGVRGYVQNLPQSADDLIRVMVDAEQAMKQSGIRVDVLPRYLYGHSMGALVTLMALTKLPEQNIYINGVVISSPPIVTDNDLAPKHLRVAANVLSRVTPKKGVDDFPLTELSRNAAAIEAYKNDDMIYHGQLRARIGAEILRHQQYVSETIHTVQIPILLLHGTADKICPPASSQLIYNRINTQDKHLLWFGGGKHELHEDQEWSELYDRAVVEFVSAKQRYSGNDKSNSALAWRERTSKAVKQGGLFLWHV